MSVCPVIIEAVKVSRDKSDVKVQFTVRNTGGTVVTNVSLNSATLKGISTKTALPIRYPQLKPGEVKHVEIEVQRRPGRAGDLRRQRHFVGRAGRHEHDRQRAVSRGLMGLKKGAAPRGAAPLLFMGPRPTGGHPEV